uniref:Epididymal secretory protein E1 n=1 Tax=Parasteatoda tepidariorum TaxID=114398 RepID=A0A2L2YVQ8_PARTP
MPFSFPYPDVCMCGLACLFMSLLSYIYKIDINVSSSYPPIPVTVKYELKDQIIADLACVSIPIHIHLHF